MGFFLLRLRASLVSRNSIPTCSTRDHQIFAGGTAYMTDDGMTGDYDS